MLQKTVLITGCSNGSAGAALALEFRQRDYLVFATSTDGTRMEALKGKGIVTSALDLTSQKSIDDCVDSLTQATDGSLDILVNNAAIFEIMPLADVNISEARKLYDINVFGALAVIQAFIPLLMKSENQGLVANVASVSAVMCPAWQGIYASSKAAMVALCNTLRVELAPMGVRVVSIMSGGVDTGGSQALRLQPRKLPKESLYRDIAYDFETNGQGGNMEMISPEKYARQVVDDLTVSKPKPLIWRGSYTWLSWLTTWFGWVGMMDAGQRKRIGLGKLALPTKGA